MLVESTAAMWVRSGKGPEEATKSSCYALQVPTTQQPRSRGLQGGLSLDAVAADARLALQHAQDCLELRDIHHTCKGSAQRALQHLVTHTTYSHTQFSPFWH